MTTLRLPLLVCLAAASLGATSAPASAQWYNKEGDTLPVPIVTVGDAVRPGQTSWITLSVGRAQWSGPVGAVYGVDLTRLGHEVVALVCPAAVERYQTQRSAYCRIGLDEDGGEHGPLVMAVQIRNIGAPSRVHRDEAGIYAASGFKDAVHPLSLTSL